MRLVIKFLFPQHSKMMRHVLLLALIASAAGVRGMTPIIAAMPNDSNLKSSLEPTGVISTDARAARDTGVAAGPARRPPESRVLSGECATVDGSGAHREC